MIKAVFIDIDDTLVNNKREVSKISREQIKRCIDKGIKIILTSGRSKEETLKYQKDIKSSPYIIASNGATAYDVEKNKEIYLELLNKNIINKLLDFAIQNDYKISLNYKDKLVMNKYFYEDEIDKVKSIEELQEIIENEEIVQCVISDKNIEKMKEFKEYLEKEFLGVKIINESKKLTNPDLKPSKNYYCDVVSDKVSKGNAVKKICEYLKIDMNEIITIGDGENDISMFELTKYSIAMGNAISNIKEKANFVTDSNEEDGVAKVLEKL